MIDPDKIEEWIKEVQERPASAPLIIQYIANRLRDLHNRNEELLKENIALQSGRRTEEYEQRIRHLEYQLELLRRQFGDSLPAVSMASAAASAEVPAPPEVIQVLVYHAQGRLLRLEGHLTEKGFSTLLASLQGELAPDGTPPRLLGVAASEELLFLFTSGRVATLPVANIPLTQPAEDKTLDWRRVAAPYEPRAGESLACLVPLSRLALADSFVQVSRRGYAKKIRASMAQSILANRYIGTGVTQPADRTFDLFLCENDDHLVLTSWEGYLLCLEVKKIPSSIEEAMHLGLTDHLVAAFVSSPEHSALIMTQVGKAIQRSGVNLEVAASLKAKGQAIFSHQRREQGVRVVGAASVGAASWAAALHRDGQLTLHRVSDLFDSGAVEVSGELLAFTAFTPPAAAG